MLPFRKVLFPVDYSGPCYAVVPYVSDIVQHFDAELTLVHAYPNYHRAYGEMMAPERGLEDGIEHGWEKKVQLFQEENLRKFAQENFPARHVEVSAHEGEPGTVIRNIVEREGTDLVMMPTRGQGPVRRFLLGSVTAKILHDISAAVWTEAGPALEHSTTTTTTEHPPAQTPYQSILCALDQSEEGEAVLRAAACMAETYHAQLFLLHAIPLPPLGQEIDFTDCEEELTAAADTHLRQLKAKLDLEKRLGREVPHTVTSAMMIDAVREEALRRKADLLVVGRGAAQAKLSAIWSNLYPLIREAPCPVLSI